jgi:dolichyl-diphosphooligosaccharide--protein glycosyltransferase
MRERLGALRRQWPLAAIVVAGFLLRTIFLVDAVFTGGDVNYQDSDAWYHMRLIDNLARNYPHRVVVDPYLGPDAPPVPVPLLFDLFVAGVAWVLGLGTPSSRTVDVVGAFTPPILGALTAIPVFRIGARLFDRRTGLLAAALLAIAPGPFLTRSVLGFTDHHVAEAFLAALTILACVVALQTDESRPRFGRAALAAVPLIAYLLTWSGGALLVFVLCAWGVVQYVVDDFHRRPDDRVARVLLPALSLALGGLLTLQDRGLWRFAVQTSATVAALAVVTALGAGRCGLRHLGAPRGALLALMAGLAIAGALLAAVLAPELTGRIVADLQRFRPRGTGLTVGEVRPLLWRHGALSFGVPLHSFGPPFFVALVALGALAWRGLRTAEPSLLLLVTWSTAMFLATLGQSRFGYYLTLNLALLGGWACAAALNWAAARAAADPIRGARWPQLQVVILAMGVVFVPSVLLAYQQARIDRGLPAGYRASLDWLRHNTPEPFAAPDYYHMPYRPGATLQPAYTVMAWWDYGYEIIRRGRRVPVASPTQAGAGIASRFFTATDEAEAVRILDQTRSRYVTAHRGVPMLPRGPLFTGTFPNLVTWAGKEANKFSETFQAKDGQGQLRPIVLFLPDYYRTLIVRLYVFGGERTVPRDSTYVFTYAEGPQADGTIAKEILEAQRFKTYEDAVVYLDRVGHTNRVIGGLDPELTPVPLEPLTRLRLIHESPAAPPAVRIFEYLGAN